MNPQSPQPTDAQAGHRPRQGKKHSAQPSLHPPTYSRAAGRDQVSSQPSPSSHASARATHSDDPGQTLPAAPAPAQQNPTPTPHPPQAYSPGQPPARPQQQQPQRHAGQRNPRVLAALCYALPILPAIYLLIRERRNRFVRFHAVQSLVFFACIFLAQAALFVALVAIGGTVSSLNTAAIFGLIFYALFVLIGILGFICWLRLIADAMAGRHTPFPILGGVSMGLDKLLAGGRRRSRQSAPLPQPHSPRAKE